MYTETVTFVEHKTFDGDSQFGHWTKSVFVDQQGREFGVFTNKAPGAALASQILPLLNQPVTVTFEIKNERFNIKSVAANGAAPAVAVVGPNATGGNAAPQQPHAPAPVGAGRSTDPERELKIHRQSALERAILTFGAAGVDPLENLDALLELSDQYIDYFNNGREAVSVVAEPTVGDVEYDAAAAEAVVGPVA